MSAQVARDVRGTDMAGGLNLFVLIDALGWSYLQGRDFLSDLLPYRRPLRTVLGFSSGVIPSILTGLSPAQNGHWNLFYYDPHGSPFRWLRPVGSLLPDHRVTRKLLKEIGRRVLGLGPLFECSVSPRLLPYFNWVEKRNIYARGGIPGARSIIDRLADQGVPYRAYSYHTDSDAGILRRARRDVERGEATFFLLYLSELDRLLHQHCLDDGRLDERLRWYAAGLRAIFEAALRRDPEARFTVFSDHGMTPVRHPCDVVQEIESLGLSMPNDYLAVYDSTMARFWFFTGPARTKITDRLRALPCGQLLEDQELERLGVLFLDRRYGETIFLMHPGWLLARSDFNGPGWTPTGMHGYHPDDPASDAMFLSNREPSVAVWAVTDVYECMRRAMGPLGDQPVPTEIAPEDRPASLRG